MTQSRGQVGNVARLALAMGVAFGIALATVALLPPDLLYPAYCSEYPKQDGVPIQPGQFCIRYDPALGRYETPPNIVPADVAKFATDRAHPDNFRLAYGTLAFGIGLVSIWALMSVARRPRTSRLAPRRPAE